MAIPNTLLQTTITPQKKSEEELEKLRSAKAAQTKAAETAKEYNRNLAKVDPTASLLGDDYKQGLEDYAAVKDFGDADFSERPSGITGFSPNTSDNADAESVARGSEILQRFATAEEANRGYLASPDQETTTEAPNKPSSSENDVSKPSQQVSDTVASVAGAATPKKIDYTNAPVMGPIYEPTNEGRGAEMGQKQPTYESSIAEFNEKFGDTVRGSLRPKEGETGDQFQARLKERAALKRRIAKLRPEEEEKNIVQKGLDFVKDLGARFAERRQESPTGRQQEPSEASRQTPTAATQQPAVPDSGARLTGRREFAKDIARAGGYGNLSGSQKDRAVALGLKRADINKFFERQETRQANARPRLQGARGVEGATGRLGEKRSLGRDMGEDVAFVQTPSQDEERRRRRLTPAQILNAYNS